MLKKPLCSYDGAIKELQTGDSIVPSVVPISSKSGNYTIASDDSNTVIVFTTVATLTLPAASGFPEGFNCVVWNQASTAVDTTFSGTYIATGTKIAQKCAASILVVNSTWYIAGSLS